MDGKVVDESFTLTVSIFQTSHERGVSSSAGIGWYAKKFNNLFVKNFPREDFGEEDLKVRKSHQFRPNSIYFCCRNCSSPTEKS